MFLKGKYDGRIYRWVDMKTLQLILVKTCENLAHKHTLPNQGEGISMPQATSFRKEKSGHAATIELSLGNIIIVRCILVISC